MFGGNSSNKNKRRSFFHFGSESKPNASPIKTLEKTVKATTTSHNSNSPSHKTQRNTSPLNKPLSKSPLMNFDDVSKHTDVSTSKTNQAHHTKTKLPSSNETLNKVSYGISSHDSVVRNQKSLDDKIIQNSTMKTDMPHETIPVLPQKTRARRPPPPTLDMDALSHSIERNFRLSSQGVLGSLESKLSIKEIPSLSTTANGDEEINSHSNMNGTLGYHNCDIDEDKTPSAVESVPSEEEPNISTTYRRQHRRQRSEAEELVDDIDIYIKEYKENSKSVDDLLAVENQDHNESGPDLQIDDEALNTDVDKLITTDIPSTESSLLYVSPLDVVNNSADQDKFSRNTLTIANKTTNGPSSSDEGEISVNGSSSSYSSSSSSRFSFSNSVEGKDAIVNRPEETAQLIDSPPRNSPSNSRSSGNSSLRSYNHEDNLVLSIPTINQDNRPEENTHENNIARESSSFYGERPPEHFAKQLPAFNDEYTINTSVDMVPKSEVPRRTFRIANEDHPTFYIKDDTSTIDQDTSTSQSFESQMDDIQVPIDHPYEIGNETTMSDTEIITSTDLTDLVSTMDRPIVPRTLSSTPDNSTLTSGEKSLRSVKSQTTTSSKANEPTSKLVSSYVEELRLKYFQTSNFLQAPPNLPLALKQKNNLIQPKNIKVKIRTNTKQVGIKHGKVKQKLLSFETTTTDNKGPSEKRGGNNATVDHTKEFHNLFNKEITQQDTKENENQLFGSESDYMNDIPGDEAYDSDDILAPLREKKGGHNTISRDGTVLSYYTRSKNRMRDKTEDIPDLPTNITIDKYKNSVAGSQTASNKDGRSRSGSLASVSTQLLNSKISGSMGLHVANPDSDSD